MKRKTIFIASLSILLGIFFSYRFFLNNNIVYQNNGIRVYSLNVFGNNILLRTNKENILRMGIIAATDKLLYPPEVINIEQNKWITLFTRTQVMLYSIDKKSLYRFFPKDKYIVSGCVSTIDKTKAYRLLIITAESKGQYGDNLIIANIGEKINIICHKQMKTMKPWKIQTGDVDGDGINEISILMYKKTPFNPIMANRPFLYQWIGEDIAPKWLGSRLAMPFEDLIFADINADGKDELLSIETKENSHKVLMAYTWKGFGFEALGSSDEYDKITKLHSEKTIRGTTKIFTAMVYKHNKLKIQLFMYKDNKIEEYNNGE